jgi:site-specific DNA-methyltransferase (adenine-specific)
MSTWTLHRGDALSLLRSLPDSSVSATITDPPYNSGGTTTTQRTSDTARG